MRKNLGYLYGVARQMMGVLEVWQFIASSPEIIGDLVFTSLFQADIERELRAWGDDKLGLLAALGRGGGEAKIDRGTIDSRASDRATLTDVGLGMVTTEFMSGRVLLLKLASLTVVAAMLDLARKHQRDTSMDPIKVFEQMPDRCSHRS